MTMTFKPASRSGSSLMIGIIGQTSTGKTYSALLLTRGLVGEKGKIAFVDCEGGMANLYAHVTDFDIITLNPPYTPEKFIEAIDSAVAAGYNAVILDTISHEWSGEGGILDEQSAIENKDPKRRWSCWGELTPRHNKFLNAMIRSPIHVVATMRMKMKYTVDYIDGKNTPRKIGLEPIQRENVEYEFPFLLEMDASHTATVIKDKSEILGEMFRPTVETGNALRVWIEEGIDIIEKEKKPEPAPVQQTPKTTYDETQVKLVKGDYEASGWSMSIFEQARLPDGLYDGDMIKADWKKRKELAAAKPTPPKNPVPKPAVVEKKPAPVPQKKPADKPAAVEKKPEPAANTDDILCEKCGAKLTLTQKNMSIIFCNGAIYCDECRRKYKAGEFTSPEEVF